MRELLLFGLIVIVAIASICTWRHFWKKPIPKIRTVCGTYSVPPMIERDSDNRE